MPFEPTIKTNPHQLTINQHVHTAHAIEKFYNSSRKVEVIILENKNKEERKKRAKLFCTKRTWDQRAEKGYMIQIETAFHNEIDNIKSFHERNHEALSKYSLLWKLRHYCHLNIKDDAIINETSGTDISKEEEEIIEKKQASFIRKGGILPSRFDSGFQIQLALEKYWDTYRQYKWGLIEATKGEFLVADGYGSLAYIPISPKLAFLATEKDQKITKAQLINLNKISIQSTKEYYFARKLSNCYVT